MRHNKKRNTALLYEFLIRHVTRCLVESKADEANKAVSLIKKYFKSGPLCEELHLFNQVLKNQVQTAEYAAKILAEVESRASRIPTSKADEVKGNLIHDINKSFQKESFYNHKIPNYSVYASLQSLINDASGHKKLTESFDRIRLQERIVTFMVTERDRTKEALKANPQYNSAVYRMVLQKFNKKYNETLSAPQKSLLAKYAVSLVTENKTVLVKALGEAIDSAQEALSFINNVEVRKDKDLSQKIKECKARLIKTDKNDPSKENVISVLRFMALADEVSQ